MARGFLQRWQLLGLVCPFISLLGCLFFQALTNLLDKLGTGQAQGIQGTLVPVSSSMSSSFSHHREVPVPSHWSLWGLKKRMQLKTTSPESGSPQTPLQRGLPPCFSHSSDFMLFGRHTASDATIICWLHNMSPHWMASFIYWRCSKWIIYYSCHPQFLSTENVNKKEKLYVKEKRGKGYPWERAGREYWCLQKAQRAGQTPQGVSEELVFFASGRANVISRKEDRNGSSNRGLTVPGSLQLSNVAPLLRAEAGRKNYIKGRRQSPALRELQYKGGHSPILRDLQSGEKINPSAFKKLLV